MKKYLKKYLLSNEIDENLRRHKWRQAQITMCGWCGIAMFWMLVMASLGLTGCTSAPKEKCETKAESVTETVIGGVLMSQGWGYDRGCQ
jgi:hypothetical protein|tara:strand:+ start:9379 stop:9645 length:267 start_codon:yes stop_codon:yes gene_type:complete